MDCMRSKEEFDPAWIGEVKPKDTRATDTAVAQLSTEWQAQHKKRSAQIEDELRKQHPSAGADECVLVQLTAHDLALAEVLAETQTQLAHRIHAMIDNPKVALALAKSLREVTSCRNSATRRVEELLATAGVLRGQRKLAEVVPLRRVA